ncbi:MAG: energy-coupling factor transporter transmembrane component T, partial [Chloroflexota bacterium]
MSDSLSLYIDRRSGLHRLNPLTKLTVAGFCLIAGLSLPGLLSGYVLLIGVLIPLSVWGSVSRAFLGRTWKVVLPFVISVILIQGLLWRGGTPLVAIGPISFKQEGVLFAVTSVGRMLAVVGSFLLLSLSTRPDSLMIGLTQHGFSASVSYIILTTLQIVPRFQAKARQILDAQRARGLETEGNILTRLKALLPLLGPLILSSIIEVEDRAIALEARAFKRSG